MVIPPVLIGTRIKASLGRMDLGREATLQKRGPATMRYVDVDQRRLRRPHMKLDHGCADPSAHPCPSATPAAQSPLVNKGRGRTGIGASDVLALRRGKEREFAYERSSPMWVLMYVFSYSVSPAATADKAEWRLLPTVVFQEFTSEDRCRAAKGALEGSLKEAGARLRSGLEDLKAIGKADPAQVIIAYNVECLPK